MAFHWQLIPAERVPEDPVLPGSFTSQSDAESWVGENWRALAEAGVEQAVLLDGQSTIYEMGLTAD